MFSIILFHVHSTAIKPANTQIIKMVNPKKSNKSTAIHKDKFLEKAIKGFMENNYEIMSIQENLKAVMYDYNKERGHLLPSLDLKSNLVNEQNSEIRSNPRSNMTSLNYGFEVGYTLFDGFSLLNRVRSKDFEVQAKLYEGLGKISKKIFEFIKLIINIQKNEMLLESTKRDVDRKKKMYTEAQNRVAVGASGKQDEFQARAVLNESEGKLSDVQDDFKNAKRQFAEWTGMKYEKMPLLGIPEEILSNLDEFEKHLSKTNFDILAAQASMRAAEKNQKSINSKLFSPKLRVGINAGNSIVKGWKEKEKYSENYPKETQSNLSTKLEGSINLWSGGSDKAEALGAGKQAKAARQEFYSAAQDTKINFQNTREKFISAQDDQRLCTCVVNDYRKSYDIAMDKYKMGAISFNELSELSYRLYNAEQILIRKESERCESAWELTKIVGSLTPQKLCNTLSETFDPISDYNKVKSSI